MFLPQHTHSTHTQCTHKAHTHSAHSTHTQHTHSAHTYSTHKAHKQRTQHTHTGHTAHTARMTKRASSFPETRVCASPTLRSEGECVETPPSVSWWRAGTQCVTDKTEWQRITTYLARGSAAGSEAGHSWAVLLWLWQGHQPLHPAGGQRPRFPHGG